MACSGTTTLSDKASDSDLSVVYFLPLTLCSQLFPCSTWSQILYLCFCWSSVNSAGTLDRCSFFHTEVQMSIRRLRGRWQAIIHSSVHFKSEWNPIYLFWATSYTVILITWSPSSVLRLFWADSDRLLTSDEPKGKSQVLSLILFDLFLLVLKKSRV